MRPTPRLRLGHPIARAVSLLLATMLVSASPALGASPSPAASPSPSPAGSPGAERTSTACPVALETAIGIAGETLVPYEIYAGAPTFSAETVDGVTTYTCGYSAPGDPSVSSLTLSLSYSLDASAASRWATFLTAFLGPDHVATDRVPGEAYERVWSDEAGARVVSLDVHTPDAYIQANVAAYGTQHTIDQVRTMVDAWAAAAIEALSGVPGSPAP
jgi:hypothetical protein